MKTFSLTIGIGKTAEGIDIPRDNAKEILTMVDAEACKRFGGFTRIDSFGGWIDDSGNVITEPGVIYTIGVDIHSERTDAEADTIVASKARDFAELARTAFAQQSVVLTIDGNMEFIS